MPGTVSELFDRVVEHLRQELGSIRTGRATPELVEHILIESYGTRLPLVQLAGITTPDHRTVLIQPWDKNVLKDIERGLQQSDLGMTPVNDGTVIRMTIPSLTEERRREYVKILHQKVEQARVAIRKIREDRLRELKEQKQSGKISEDIFFSEQKELQKLVDDLIGRADTFGTQKEEEVMTV